MTNTTLPILTQSEINAAKNDTWDFLFLFIDSYYKTMASDPSEEVMQAFSDNQHTLLAFNSLYGQVVNGGFLQLIQNGYGGYIFENPFSEHIKSWGAVEIAKIVDEAKIIYEKYKAEIEKESTLEEVSKMYTVYTEFNPLEDKFYEIMDEEVEVIRKYIENNLSLFAIVTE